LLKEEKKTNNYFSKITPQAPPKTPLLNSHKSKKTPRIIIP
jgi:hypothetical protein